MSVTPDFVGQIYKDTNTGNLWRANSTAAGDLSLELQNTKLKWTPTNIDLMDEMLITSYGMAGITSITLLATTSPAIDLELFPILASFAAPNLTTISGAFGTFWLKDNTALTSVSIPLLATVYGFAITGNNLLGAFSIPSLTTLGEGGLDIEEAGITSISLANLIQCTGAAPIFWIKNCTLLTSVSCPNFVPSDGMDLQLTGNALDATTINDFLAKCVANAGFVSGLVDLRGGTNAAPSGQGILDKATLNARLPGLCLTN